MVTEQFIFLGLLQFNEINDINIQIISLSDLVMYFGVACTVSKSTEER